MSPPLSGSKDKSRKHESGSKLEYNCLDKTLNNGGLAGLEISKRKVCFVSFNRNNFLFLKTKFRTALVSFQPL
jgi:hypothetical protein